MKKILVLMLLAVLSVWAFAQQFTLDGEVKTGLLYGKFEDGLADPIEKIGLGSKDDAGKTIVDGFPSNTGSSEGRFRLNMTYANEEGKMGFKTRLNWENWRRQNPKAPDFPYAFGYGDFFEDQLTISIGILGASPWGTGGPEMWKELDVSQSGGMRVEWKPEFVPGELNVGFVLNYFDSPSESGGEIKLTMWEILRESVLGAAYTHEFFHVRFAYRLDSDYDQRIRTALSDGDDLLYRVEERILDRFLPGFQIWALGFVSGVGAEKECLLTRNWLFFQYAPDLFTAQLRVGMEAIENRTLLFLRPNFYWNFFDKLIVAGMAFQYGQDFGEGKMYEGSPYSHIEIEPKVQINFNANAYAAFVYNWRREYISETNDHIDEGIKPITQVQWFNLRFGMRF